MRVSTTLKNGSRITWKSGGATIVVSNSPIIIGPRTRVATWAKSPEEAAWALMHPFSIPDPQGIGEMPSSPDPRPPIFFEILCGFFADCYSPPPTNTIGWSRPCLHPRPTGYRSRLLIPDRSFFFEILCADCYSPAPPTNTIGWSRPCLPILQWRPPTSRYEDRDMFSHFDPISLSCSV